jgi:hypothetical protein
MEREASRAFLDSSLGFVARMRSAVQGGLRRGLTELWPLTQAVNEELGPFPEFAHELAASVRAHLSETPPT